MNLRALLAFNAVLATVHAIGFVFFPAALLDLYQVKYSPESAFLGQLFGTELLLVAIIAWKARRFTSPDALVAVVLSGLAANVVGAVVCSRAILMGVQGTSGWLGVGFYVLLSLGFLMAYLQRDRWPEAKA